MSATDGYAEMCKGLQTLWDDGERVFCRARRPAEGGDGMLLIAQPAIEQPYVPTSIGSLTTSRLGSSPTDGRSPHRRGGEFLQLALSCRWGRLPCYCHFSV
jgi:hypothetical protein